MSLSWWSLLDEESSSWNIMITELRPAETAPTEIFSHRVQNRVHSATIIPTNAAELKFDCGQHDHNQ